MSLLEIILLIIVLGFGISGLKLGLIQAVGSIIGLFVGYAFAVQYVGGVAHFLTPFFAGNAIAATITAFILLFVIASKLIGMLFYFLDKLFRIASLIPGIGALNRLGGFVLGILEGVVIIGIVLTILTHLPASAGTKERVQSSPVLRAMTTTSKIVTAFFPKARERIENVIER